MRIDKTVKQNNSNMAHCWSVKGFLSDNRADTTLVGVLAITGLGLVVMKVAPGLNAPVRSAEPSEQTRTAHTRTWYSVEGESPVRRCDVEEPQYTWKGSK